MVVPLYMDVHVPGPISEQLRRRPNLTVAWGNAPGLGPHDAVWPKAIFTRHQCNESVPHVLLVICDPVLR